jgi:hypothetical protein
VTPEVTVRVAADEQLVDVTRAARVRHPTPGDALDDVEIVALPHPAALIASRSAAVAGCVQRRRQPSFAVAWKQGRRDTIRQRYPVRRQPLIAHGHNPTRHGIDPKSSLGSPSVREIHCQRSRSSPFR